MEVEWKYAAIINKAISNEELYHSYAIGVMTYQILTDKDRVGELAVMLSVPFDYNWFKNWFALCVFEENIPCDENMMYWDRAILQWSENMQQSSAKQSAKNEEVYLHHTRVLFVEQKNNIKH